MAVQSLSLVLLDIVENSSQGQTEKHASCSLAHASFEEDLGLRLHCRDDADRTRIIAFVEPAAADDKAIDATSESTQLR